MKIVIDIPEEAYKLLNNEGVDWLGAEHILNAVAKGTLLKQTDGDLISRNNLLKELEKWEWQELYLPIHFAELVADLPSAEKTANKININEYVKVKLTNYGKEIFYHQFDEINSFYKCEKIKPHYPKVDKEGYTSFQLWHFMNLYGNYIDMGMQNVIEPLEIVFESAEKTAVYRNNGSLCGRA